jgi:hypothetical protein
VRDTEYSLNSGKSAYSRSTYSREVTDLDSMRSPQNSDLTLTQADSSLNTQADTRAPGPSLTASSAPNDDVVFSVQQVQQSHDTASALPASQQSSAQRAASAQTVNIFASANDASAQSAYEFGASSYQPKDSAFTAGGTMLSVGA